MFAELAVTGLTPGHEYKFRVAAVNAEGESEPLETLETIIAKNPFGKLSIYYPWWLTLNDSVKNVFGSSPILKNSLGSDWVGIDQTVGLLYSSQHGISIILYIPYSGEILSVTSLYLKCHVLGLGCFKFTAFSVVIGIQNR